MLKQAAFACTLNEIAQTRIEAVVTQQDPCLSILHFHHNALVYIQRLNIKFRHQNMNSQWLPFIHQGLLRFLISVEPLIVITPNLNIGGECMLYSCYSNHKMQNSKIATPLASNVYIKNPIKKPVANVVTSFKKYIIVLYYHVLNKTFSLYFLNPQSLLFIGESFPFQLSDPQSKWEVVITRCLHVKEANKLELHYSILGEPNQRKIEFQERDLDRMCLQHD